MQIYARTTSQIRKAKEEVNKQSSESNVSLSKVELDTLVALIVRHMIFSSYEKPGVPVTRAKLSELILADNKNHKNAKKLLSYVLPVAQVWAIVCFGFTLLHLRYSSF